MSLSRCNPASRCRTYRKIVAMAIAMPILLFFVLMLLVFTLAPAGASPDRPVHVTYIYSPMCSVCEHVVPVIHKTVESSKGEGITVQYEEISFRSKEGMAFMERFGLSSVPAVIVDDSAIRFEDFNGDTGKLKTILKDRIAEASHYKTPVVLQRRIQKSPDSDNVKVVTCVTNAGEEPVEVEVKGGLCEGVNVIGGDTSWKGTMMPGDKRYLTYEADVGGSVRSLPPQMLAYTDSMGEHSVVGQETPVFLLKKLSLAGVFLAGLVAGINPCLLAIMAFVSAMALSGKGNRLGVMLNLLAFCGGLMAIYLLMGIGFLKLIEYAPSVTLMLKAGIIILLIALAGWAFYDAYRTKTAGDRPSAFKSFLDRYKPVYRKFSLAANFGLGGAFGLIKMPCVGGIYVAILGAIVQAGEVKSSLPYLAAYNLGIILPVLALGALLTLGLSPGTVNKFRHRHRVTLKVVSGIILMLMATGFLLNII